MNAPHVINAQNESTTEVVITWPGHADPGAMATVRLATAGTQVASPPGSVMPSQSQSVVLDASSLPDGPVDVFVDVTDAGGRSSTFAGTPAYKTVAGPVLPLFAGVMEGPGNAPDLINASNVNSVFVVIEWPPQADPGSTATVTLDDGNAAVTSPGVNAMPGGQSLVNLDSATLADGSVAVIVDVIDPSMSMGSFAGRMAIRAVNSPVAPTLAFVAAGPGNARNEITPQNLFRVAVEVHWPPQADGLGTAQVALMDGTVSATSAAFSPTPGEFDTVSIDASSLADGPITVEVQITDGGGLMGTYQGDAAIKGPAIPDIIVVTLPSTPTHPENIIDGFDAASATIETLWGVGATGNETVHLDVSDGSTTLNFGPLSPAAGGGTLSFAGLDLTSLADGAIRVSATATDGGASPRTLVLEAWKRAGRHHMRRAFVAQRADDTLTSWIWDAPSRSFRAGMSLPTGAGPEKVLRSQTNDFVVVLCAASNELQVFPTDPWGELLGFGTGAPTGGTPTDMALDPRGRFGWIAVGSRIDTYAIDAQTGMVVPSQSRTLPNAVQSIALDASGRELLALDSSGTVTWFDVDQRDGILNPRTSTTCVGAPRRVLWHASARFAFVLCEPASGSTVDVLATDRMAQTLNSVATQTFAASVVSDIAATPDGRWLIASEGASNRIAVFGCDPMTGGLTPAAGSPFVTSAAIDRLQSGPSGAIILGTSQNDHGLIALSIDPMSGATAESDNVATRGLPTGIALDAGPAPWTLRLEQAFVANPTSDQIEGFQVDDMNGMLTGSTLTPAQGGPTALAMGARGGQLFALAPGSQALRAFLISPVGPIMTELTPTAMTGTTASALIASASGHRLWVSDSATNQVQAYDVQPASSPLAASTPSSTDVDPIDMALHPSGHLMVVLSGQLASLRAHPIDSATGTLGAGPSATATGTNPSLLRLHPSGRWALVAHQSGDLGRYTVDTATGAILPVGTTVGPADPSDARFSPDGTQLWVTTRTGQALHTFDVLPGAALSSVGAPVAFGVPATSISVSPRADFLWVTTEGVSSEVHRFDVTPGTAPTPAVNQSSLGLSGTGTTRLALRVQRF